MVERYSLGVSAEQLEASFKVEPFGFERPRYNAAPAQLLPVITMDSKGLSHFYWGTMPQWSKNKAISEKLINVRAEAIPERVSTRKALMKFRCLVPADGFYGWKKIGKKSAIPYRCQLADRSLFGMAGLWEEFDDESGEIHHTFTLITVPSTAEVAPIMERMPLLLSKESNESWLSSKTEEAGVLALLQTPVELKVDSYTVSPRINQTGIDEATLVRPAPPADQFGNLTLFS